MDSASSGYQPSEPAASMQTVSVGQRLSTRQINARAREFERQERVAQAQAKIAEENQNLENIVHFWKDLPNIPTEEEIQKARKKFPFQSFVEPPALPDWEAEQRATFAALVEKAHARVPYLLLPKFYARKKASAEFNDAWGVRETEIQESYASACEQYQTVLLAEQQSWDAREEERIAWLERLLSGDVDETHRTAEKTVSTASIPFALNCDLIMQECSWIGLNIDVPPAETTVPPTQKTVLQSGEVKVTARNETERNRLYDEIALGECLYLAALLFATLPLLQNVSLAACTNRPARSATDPEKPYILDWNLLRRNVAAFEKKSGDIFTFATNQGARFDLASNYLLRNLAPPLWLQEHKENLEM
jgi:hypothetical protein